MAYPTAMGTTECTNAPGSGSPSARAGRPAARVARTYVAATTTQHSTSPSVPLGTAAQPVSSPANDPHHCERVTPSNAVDPSRIATYVTSPGSGTTPERPPRGLRSASRPSGSLPNGDSRPMSVEYTSNASARANHPAPYSDAPTRCAAP